ncbi:ATP-binding cassette domain-containing protein [Marinobacter salinexigens]|uniref:ATP-binding cassette domain-containing protein n=1 Tax=Marinobacter salinexigens TaxID=2919747 RepID=A0A5B0VH50_9GAMM|nr:ATP-binding cassette domain-containing protein [Marinobacter salinexigens]KAA1173946.1 ATP-binding cassette domain-containing protein [Marinobacter salinexigens]
MLDVQNLTFSYAPEQTPWTFSFQLEPGECIAIQGPSGSGKSTLMNLLAGFLTPRSGDLLWKGRSLLKTKPWERPITSVFQENNLFEHLNVLRNIGLGIHPGMKLSVAQQQAVENGLREVGLGGLGRRMPSELSGGQRQRVALLRALLRDQPLLLLDEPLTGLDAETRALLRSMLLQHKSRGTAIVLASHDEEDRQRLADTVWNL